MKFTIYLPDALGEQVQAAMADGMNASAVCQDALHAALGHDPEPLAGPPGFTRIGRAPGGTVLLVHDAYGECGAVVTQDQAWAHDNWHENLNAAMYGSES